MKLAGPGPGTIEMQEPQEGRPDKKSSLFRLETSKGVTLRVGKWLEVEPTLKLQTEFRLFQPDLETSEGALYFRRARVGVKGDFLKDFSYQLEGELRPTKKHWKDVYLNYRFSRALEIRAGKFKIPLGQDQLTSVADLNFVSRSIAGNFLAPGRDIGVMAHGRVFRFINYAGGVFREDGDGIPSGRHSFAARLLAAPLKELRIPSYLGNFELGAAFTSSVLPDGAPSVEAEAASGVPIFESVFVGGRRMRLGVEAAWTVGPFSLLSEFIQVRDERRGQGVRQDDLPNLLAQGWHVSGTWAITGEKKEENLRPRKDFLSGGGIGALELAARYERALFASSSHPGRASRNPRAANILGNSNAVWTFGLNWYLNRYVRFQVNSMNETIEDTARSPIAGEEHFWIQVFRIQFAL